MTKTEGQETPAGVEQTNETKDTRHWLTRQMSDFYSVRDEIKKHPLKGTALALLVAVLTLAGNEAFAYAKSKILGPDEFLVQMAADQKAQFSELRKNLSQLGSSISGKDRAAYDDVRDAVKSLEANNGDLLQQLLLAKRENASLSKLAAERSGVTGGYDVILSASDGIRLDPANVLGVRFVNHTTVGVSLTSESTDGPISKSLKSGESITYIGANKKARKVSLLSIGKASAGAASFAVNCS